MNIFQRLFTRELPRTIDHELFGTLTYSRHDGWINSSFNAFGYRSIELLIDAGPDGPTTTQVDAFKDLEAQHSHILSRCHQALETTRREMGEKPGNFILDGITIPSFKDQPQGKLWTLWFNCPEDEHFMYGVQSDDGWQTLYPFADD